MAPRLLLLCGHTPEKALTLGYEFYSKVIYADDMPLLIRIHHASLGLLFNMHNPHEKEIHTLARHGKNGKEIADTLYISYHTLRNHESNIYQKLETNSLATSVIYAVNHRLI